MTTIHANTPRDALSRLEQMVGMAGMPMHEGMKMPMHDGMKMPSTMPAMAKDKPGCCAMKTKMPMAKPKHARHRRHAKPAAAKPAPMPAAAKPMPMKDDM